MSDRPEAGIFIVWDVEDVEVVRRDAGTTRDRTVVIGRWTVPMRALWSNEISDERIAAAERYVEQNARHYDNLRVEVERPKETQS